MMVSPVRLSNTISSSSSPTRAPLRRTRQKHAVQPAIRNGAAIDDRHAAARLAALVSLLRDAIPRHARPQAPQIHPRDSAPKACRARLRTPTASAPRTVRRDAPGRNSSSHVPILHRHHGHNLLRQHIQRIARIAHRLDLALIHRARDRRAGHQVARDTSEKSPRCSPRRRDGWRARRAAFRSPPMAAIRSESPDRPRPCRFRAPAKKSPRCPRSVPSFSRSSISLRCATATLP